MRLAVPFAASMVLAGALAAQTLPTDLICRADTAFADEDRALAESLYLQVVQLDPEQSRPYYRLGILSANPETALHWFRRYAQLDPDDAGGRLAVGDRSRKVGRVVEALQAYERAASLAPEDEAVKRGLARGRLAAAPRMEPIAGYQGDSDGVRIRQYGARGDVAIRGGFRVGGRVAVSSVSDGDGKASFDELQLRIEGRPRMAYRLDAVFGGARLVTRPGNPWHSPEADLRLRLRAPGQGPRLEIQMLRTPLAAGPSLVANRTVSSEARLGVDLPAGPFRLRGTQRAAIIQTRDESANRRVRSDAVLAVPLGWRGEVSVQYHRSAFRMVSQTGCFAPRLVETIESGTYWELGGDGPVTLELDVGVGVQRLALQYEAAGPWKTALRTWGALGVAISRAWQLRTEVEAYDSPFAPMGVPTAPNWRYVSITAGLLVRLTPAPS